MGGLDRARADLERGDASKARQRLKGLVATYPSDLEVRALLAEAYRRDRLWPEAGRWGYLIRDAASESERRAFELHAGFEWRSRITEARLKYLLRTEDLATLSDEHGRTILRELPRRRNPRRSDGPLAAVLRRIAIMRAEATWR